MALSIFKPEPTTARLVVPREDRKYLDEEFPDTPVVVHDPSIHSCLVNAEGLKRLGYSLNNPQNPPGGRFLTRDNGEITGELLESASGRVWMEMPKPPLSLLQSALEHSMNACNKYGITSCQEASANTGCLKALREIDLSGRMTVDVHTHIVHSPARYAQEDAETLQALLKVADVFESEHVKPKFVKFWLDGSPLPPNLTQCDIGEDGKPVESTILVGWDTLLGALIKYDAKGYTCKIHCAGEGSARRALDVIEKVRQRSPSGPSHEIAHCTAIHKGIRSLYLWKCHTTNTGQMALPAARFKQLRVTAEMSPAIFHSPVVDAVPHLLKWPFRDLVDQDVRITIGTDYFLTDTPSFVPTLQAVVAKIKPEEILRAITIEGVKAVGREHELASIEVGKLANFMSVDCDFTLEDFKDARVLETWHRGRSVRASSQN